jgi:hypothetical protein
MVKTTRRKPSQYKRGKVIHHHKTSRIEIRPETRAFIVGAIIASRDGYASTNALSKKLSRSQSNLSELERRVESRALKGGFNLWDPILYENDLGRGRRALLTQEQKDAIIAITTSSRNNREKESWQAIKDGDFKDVIPEISVSTFENVMFEAGYSRRKPGWKPPLTRHQERVRYQ